MSTLYLPQKVVENMNKALNKEIEAYDEKSVPAQLRKDMKIISMFNSGNPVNFTTIKDYSVAYRDRMSAVAYFVDDPVRYPTDEYIDLMNECIALQIGGEVVDTVLRRSGFTDFIALLGLYNGRVTFSLLGAEIGDPTKISALYRNSSSVLGVETWPQRGALGYTKDFNDVLDCN